LTVLNAETQVLTARQTMLDIVTSQATARVTLLLAVGGSFDPRSDGQTAALGPAAPSTAALDPNDSSRMLTQVSP
jgi:hypothetical protein